MTRALILFALLLGPRVPAQIFFPTTARLGEVGITNTSPFLLDADLGNPAPDPTLASLGAATRLSVTFPVIPVETASYRVRFQLVDPSGGPWLLRGPAGLLEFVEKDVTVRRPALGRTANQIVAASLLPAPGLDENRRYRAVATLLSDTGAGFLILTNVVETAGHRFFQFTNTTSSDASLNVLAAWEDATIERSDAGPVVKAHFTAARFDDFEDVPAAADVEFRMRAVLRDETSGTDVPLATDSLVMTRSLASHAGPRTPVILDVKEDLLLAPSAPLAYGHTYSTRVTLEQLQADGTSKLHGSITTSPAALVPLSGKLFFGAIETRFTKIANDPLVGQVPDPDFPGEGFDSTLQVVDQSGFLPEFPGVTYGDGTPLPVHIFNNGDALYEGTPAVILQGSVNGHHPMGGVRFGYARLELRLGGFSAFDAYARLPAGSGFYVDGTSRVFQGRLPLGRVELLANGVPRQSDFTLRAADFGLANLWFHHELLPLRLATSQITWKSGEGVFEFAAGSWSFTREMDLAFLEAPDRSAVLSPSDIQREGNDQYLRTARDSGGVPVRLVVEAGGKSFLDATVSIGGGEFGTHFPAGITVPHGPGQIVIVSNIVDVALSSLEASPVEEMTLSYRQGCPDPKCAGSISGTFDFHSQDGEFHVSPDGGLVGLMTVNTPAEVSARLEWGALDATRFAHSVSEFTSGVFHAPGFALRADETSAHLPDEDRPGALLNTGYGQPEGEAPLERPRTEGYAAGMANYAGLNFRLTADGSAAAFSHLAGQRVPAQGTYPLKANSKYYVRPAGVSGRHQAVAEQFPHNLTLYGFRTSLDGLRLSYLDNVVDRSATDGGIEVPFPSDFIQSFAELRLRCNGQLFDARIQGESRHRLAYWLAPFQASTLEFRGAADAPCDTTAGVLLLGSSVTLPLVAKPALGVLGFRPDGNLVSTADNISGVDSRLQLPASLELDGPEGRPYHLAPATKAYFNNWPGAGAEPADGFVTFAGRMDLPWFLDAKVQVQAVGSGPNPFLHLAGGWNVNGHPDDPSHAWVDALGHSYFDRQDFDPSNRGFPDGITLASYRDSGSDRYRPRAQQRLLGLATSEIDFPIEWQSGSRSFRSAGKQLANLLIFDLRGEAERLSSRHAHLNFSASISDQVPHFSASEFLLGEIEGRIGVFSSVSNAIVRALANNVLATTLRDGADEFDKVLSPDLGKLLAADLLAALDGPVDSLLNEVGSAAGAGTVNAADFHQALCQQLAVGNNALRRFQDQFLETSAFVDSVGGRLVDSLTSADDAVTSAISIVELKEVAPLQFRRSVVGEVIKRAIREAPPDAPPLVRALAEKVAPDILDGLIDEYLGEALEAPLAQVEATLRQVHSTLDGLIQDLADGRGVLQVGLVQAQDALTGAGSFYGGATNAICTDFRGEMRPVVVALQDRIRIREQIKRLVLAELLKGVFPQETHLLLKQFLLANRGFFRGALDELFAHVNDTIVGIAIGPARDLLTSELAALDSGAVDALNKLHDLLKGSRLYGTADLTGDELQKLRVDGEFRFALGHAGMGQDASLALDAFYQIEQFHGDAPGRGCRPPGGSFLEVSFGAFTTPPGGFAEGLKVGLTGRYALDNQGRVQGVAGAITAKGAKKIGGFSANDPQLGFSFGDEGTYVGGSVAASFKGFVMQARLFAGAACHLSDLDFIDSNTAALLADNGIAPADKLIGFYIAGDITVPLERFLPIPLPRTCLFHVEGRGGMGYFGFLSPAAGPAFLVGMRQRLGIQGELLCLFSGEGDLDVVGAVGVNALGTPQATIAGQLKLGVELGICPVCEEVSKTFPWVVHLKASDATFDSPF